MTRSGVALCALLAACGPGQRPSPERPVGDTHVRSDAAATPDRDRSPRGPFDPEVYRVDTAADAASRLADARSAGDSLAIAVYANRVAALGGAPSVSAEELERAVDALEPDALDALAGLLDRGYAPASAVTLRRALLARHAGADAVALRLARGLRGDEVYGDRAAALADEIRQRRGADPAVVAVVLPLRGRFSAIGAELRAAVELAARQDEGVRLVFLDSGADAVTAVAAVDQAVYRHRAVAIVGPVAADASAAAAARAAELGATIALLAPTAEPAADAGVFRLWTSGEELARATADAAVEQGYDSFGVLAPRDDVGAAQAAAFAARVEERGRRVEVAGSYDPSATDLEPDLRRFLGLDPARNARLRAHLRRYKRPRDGYASFSPDVRFDALFLPDDYRRAALAVAYLPYFNVELRHGGVTDLDLLRKKHGGRIPQLVQLFGSSGWHHPGLFARGGDDVEGALLVDVWGGSPIEGYGSGGAADFAEQFVAATGREPTAAAAQAFDAALLVLSARQRIDPRRGDPRASMLRALAAARLDDGACGPARVSAAGAIERDVLLLQVESGQFIVEPY